MRLMTTASLEIAPLFFPIRPYNHAIRSQLVGQRGCGILYLEPADLWTGTSVSHKPVL